MYPVLYSPTPNLPVPIDNSQIQDEETAEFKRMESRVQQQKEKLDKLEIELQMAGEIAKIGNEGLIGEANLISSQLMAIREQLADKAMAQHGPSQETEFVMEDEPEEEAEVITPEVKADRNTRRLAAKLFKKISARTHPDKTDNPDLHQIFITAKILYDKDDAEALKLIWDGLKGSKDPTIKLDLDYLQKKSRALTEQLIAKRNTILYQLAMIIREHPDEPHVVQSMYAKFLRMTILEGQQELERLTQELEKQ